MSLRPAKYNLVIWRGATFRQRFTYHTGATADTDPTNLTSWTAELIIRPHSTTDTLTLSTQTGEIVLGGVDGTIDITIDDVVTADLNWQTAVYELLLTDTQDTVLPLLFGSVRVNGI